MLRRVQQHGGKGTFVVFGCRTSAGHHQRLFDFDEDVIGNRLALLPEPDPDDCRYKVIFPRKACASKENRLANGKAVVFQG